MIYLTAIGLCISSSSKGLKYWWRWFYGYLRTLMIKIITQFDYREKAPLLSTTNMYLDENEPLSITNPTLGYLASGVPGTVAGLCQCTKDLVQ